MKNRTHVHSVMSPLCTEHVMYQWSKQLIEMKSQIITFVGIIPAWHAWFASAAEASQPHHRPSLFVHREIYLAVGSRSSRLHS